MRNVSYDVTRRLGQDALEAMASDNATIDVSGIDMMMVRSDSTV